MAMEKTFDAGTAEPRIYAKWEADGAFKAGANASRDETFCVMIPPPNVTGSLHIGHAFNNTLQDILTRWKRMQGYDTLWQPGTDHAGIATQMVTERSMAANQEPSRGEMGREAFVDRVWQQKVESRGTIIGQLKRLGASCDWSREAFTMGGAKGDPDAESDAPDFHDAVIKVFVDMYNKGLIYKGKRLVNWDPHFETAISDLEVENIEVAGHMWHFKYPLAGGATYEYVEKDEDGNVTLRETRDYISIATTRPETMLGDGAVAVHPDDERYAPIVGKLCEIPVGPKEHRRLIPIITDEYPVMDFGSGAVKITGAHDFNDYQVAKRCGIPMYALMDTKGAMRSDGLPYEDEATIAQRIAKGEEDFDEAKIAAMNLVPDEYRGMDRFEARKAVVADINAEGLAVMERSIDPDIDRGSEWGSWGGEEDVPPDLRPHVESKPIMQPFGDRSKVVIEPMLTDQWFVDTAKIVGPAIEAVRSGEVTILPESDRKVYFHWLENIEPWCISRQLWWGHQVPVWYGPTLLDGPDGPHAEWKAFCAPSQREAFDQMEAYYGHRDFKVVTDRSEAGKILEAAIGNTRTEGKIRTPQAPSAIPVYRDPDVLDTWFSSGLWPLGTLGWPAETPELKKYFPTSTLITGTDILFFWVARMMMMQLETVGQVPFDTVYLHGLVRDDKGRKMSKSTGNVIDPLEIIDEYGADALRFTNAAMASLGGALKLDKTRIQGYRNFSTKLWNATRFAEMNGVFDLQNFKETGSGNFKDFKVPSPRATANKWIIGEVARARQEVDAAFEGFRFNDAANALYAFTWGKVCDWYVEFAKPLFDTEHADETRATMAWVLDQCYIMLHPIMPFITEELWGLTGKREKPLVHADWPTYGNELIDADADREMNWVISLIDGIRSARSQMRVPAGLKIPVILQELDAKGRAALEGNKALIMKLARIDSITELTDLPKGASPVPVEGGAFALPLADIIDVDAETTRIEKAIGKLAKEIGGLRGRLNNPKFAQSAPEEVIAETRANLALREEEDATLQAALTRLKEIG